MNAFLRVTLIAVVAFIVVEAIPLAWFNFVLCWTIIVGAAYQYPHLILAKVQAMPGVSAAGYTTFLPLTNRGGTSGFLIEGAPPLAPGQDNDANHRAVSRDRPILQRSRPAGCHPRRNRQRGHGQAVLARAESSRPPLPHE